MSQTCFNTLGKSTENPFVFCSDLFGSPHICLSLGISYVSWMIPVNLPSNQVSKPSLKGSHEPLPHHGTMLKSIKVISHVSTLFISSCIIYIPQKMCDVAWYHKPLGGAGPLRNGQQFTINPWPAPRYRNSYHAITCDDQKSIALLSGYFYRGF